MQTSWVNAKTAWHYTTTGEEAGRATKSAGEEQREVRFFSPKPSKMFEIIPKKLRWEYSNWCLSCHPQSLVLLPSHVVYRCSLQTKTRRSGPHTKCIGLVMWRGWGFQSFKVPATSDRNNSVAVAPIHSDFLFYCKKPEVERFRLRGCLSKKSEISRIDREAKALVWLSLKWDDRLTLKWYEGENVYNRDWQRPHSLHGTTQISAVLWTETKLNNFLALVVHQNPSSVWSAQFYSKI